MTESVNKEKNITKLHDFFFSNNFLHHFEIMNKINRIVSNEGESVASAKITSSGNWLFFYLFYAESNESKDKTNHLTWLT